MSTDIVQLSHHVNDLSSKVDTLSKTIGEYIAKQYGNEELSKYRNKEDKEEVYTKDYSRDENEARGNWSNKFDFFLASLGAAVGLGNIWRFPYLCYRNGGAVFLIPYSIMLFLVGIPIYLMEFSVGQYTSSGPTSCWQMARMFKGVGIAMVALSSLIAIYYCMVIGWAFYFLFASFTSRLPWSHCGNSYNSDWCADRISDSNVTDCIYAGLNATTDGVCYNNTIPVSIYNSTLASAAGLQRVIPAEEYFLFKVLRVHKSSGIDDMGDFHWDLCLCLLLSWTLVFLILIKGIKSAGKVVYFTATFPYVVLIILFVRGLFLDGYKDGLNFYLLDPDLEKLKDPQVWKDATIQIFFSLGTSSGTMQVYSSYNRFHNNILRDSLMISICNCLTSLLAGFVIFSYLGHLAQTLGVNVSDVAASGPGLTFIVYPMALTLLPIPTFWSILFFFMVITLGLDSVFAMTECVLTSIQDQFPLSRKHTSLVTFCVCIVLYICGLSMCNDGGLYMLILLDTYVGGWNFLLIALLECICIAYVYGTYRFSQDIQVMLGPNRCCFMSWSTWSPLWQACWCFFSPLLVLAVLIYSLVGYKPLVDSEYTYPTWANALGWLITVMNIIVILVTPLIQLVRGHGTFTNRILMISTPTKYWGPALIKHRLLVRHLPNFDVDPTNMGGLHAMEEGVNAAYKTS